MAGYGTDLVQGIPSTPAARLTVQRAKGHPIEVLVAYGKHEVLEGDPIEGIVIANETHYPHLKAGRDS